MAPSFQVRLADLARGFEEATIDKNNQDEKTIKMDKMLEMSDEQLVPRSATSKICGNKWPVRNLLKDLSRSHLCFENSLDMSYKITHL